MELKDPSKFFACLRREFGGLSQGQVDGINLILGAWGEGTDTRWVAYSLGTAWHETGRVMGGIREIGRGKGRRYGETYYGRGFVQLTWKENYRRFGELLGEDLVGKPDLALVGDIAAKILVRGMEGGLFTGRRLGDYFSGTRSDWIDARRIVNGLDRAGLVASYGMVFYHAMEDGE